MLANVSDSLIKASDAVKACIAGVNAAWLARPSTAKLFVASELAALSRHELLYCLLESGPIMDDVDLQRLVTNIRYLALTSAADGTRDEDLLL